MDEYILDFLDEVSSMWNNINNLQAMAYCSEKALKVPLEIRDEVSISLFAIKEAIEVTKRKLIELIEEERA